MATFTWTPDDGATKSSAPKVITTKFGDGYEQRSAVGINTLADSHNLTFSLREKVEADQIDNFLKQLAGVSSFDWTPTDESDPKKFKCAKWDRKREKHNRYTISAVFEQVFE